MESVENTVLRNLILNEEYNRKVLPFIKPEYFDNQHEKVIFEETAKFIVEYDRCPTQEIISIECEKRKDINDETFDATYLRNVLSENITEEEYDMILLNYRILHDSGDFDETWNPYEVTYTKFKDDILKNETEYWGDIHLLILLKKYLNINCVILYSNEFMNTYYHYPLSDTYDPTLKTILLLYENEMHFKLIGYFMNGNMIVSFTNDTLPHEIFKMINYDK